MSDIELGELKSAPDFKLTDCEDGKSGSLIIKVPGMSSLFSTAALFDHTAVGIWHSCARTIRNL